MGPCRAVTQGHTGSHHGRKEFEASRADGVHAQLARMAGQWQGRFRLWFAPGEALAVEVNYCRVPADGRENPGDSA